MQKTFSLLIGLDKTKHGQRPGFLLHMHIIKRNYSNIIQIFDPTSHDRSLDQNVLASIMTNEKSSHLRRFKCFFKSHVPNAVLQCTHNVLKAFYNSFVFQSRHKSYPKHICISTTASFTYTEDRIDVFVFNQQIFEEFCIMWTLRNPFCNNIAVVCRYFALESHALKRIQ